MKKHKEIFKIYNMQDIKRNKLSMFFIALSLFLTMLVSLVIPQIQMGKQQFVDNVKGTLNKADLEVNVSYPSVPFNQKIQEYEKNSIKVNQVNISPMYYQHKGNNVSVYLLSGYDNLKKGDVILSKNFADANNVKVNDRIKLSGVNKKLKVTAIEQIPIDVTTEPQVAGYIKVNSIITSANEGNHLLFISGKNGNILKKELNKIENGYTYNTLKERQKQLYDIIDNQMGALSLISTVGFILAIAVLVSGIIMLIIKSKKDIATLMLISIKKSDIMKAIKVEVNTMIFIPLLVAVVLCIPISLTILKYEGLSVSITRNYIIHILTFVFFDVLLFVFYRNLALRYIKKLDPVLIEKGEGGVKRLSFIEILCFILLFPITMIIYAALLQSGTSVNVNIFLALGILVMFLISWILVTLISILPIWKRWKCTLYTFHNLLSNTFVFIIGIINLALLICFILIGFNLSSTLKTATNKSLIMNVPYNYVIRTSNIQKLDDTLNISKDIQGYIKFNYLSTKVENEKIKDKGILLMNQEVAKGNPKFHIVEGKNITDNDSSKVLISKKYASAYKLTLGSVLRVFEDGNIHKYTIKGIYDSGGINVNWIFNSSPQKYKDTVYLVKYSVGKSPINLKDCYITNMSVLSDYMLSQANNFLESFKLLCFLFILSALMFNINLVYMGQRLLRKDFAIIDALGIGKRIIPQQMWIKGILSIIISLIVSSLLYIVISNIMIQAISSGSAGLAIGTFSLASLIIIIVTVVAYVLSRSAIKNCIEEIRE